MTDDIDDPFDAYTVVVNDEEQFSIWPAAKELPQGWRPGGKDGSKQECLDHIQTVWTDLRPLSLRRKMEAWADNPPAAWEPEPPEERSLVDRLCEGEHAVIFTCRPEPTAAAFKERLDLGYVHLAFTQTRGGTELGVSVDPHASDWTQSDFTRATGTVRIVGSLSLDYEPVRCVATIDVSTLAGTGHLERMQSEDCNGRSGAQTL